MEINKQIEESMIKLNSQIVIVINGKGGVGKDTICTIASRLFSVKTISAITPIKKIATQCGWEGGKDNKSRRFLSDLKKLLISYNDLPNRYLVDEFCDFRSQHQYDVLFVHIREPVQIADFMERIYGTRVTLLIRSDRKDTLKQKYGNSSDDNVEDYNYDYIFNNNCELDELSDKVNEFLKNMFKKEGVLL